MKPPKAPDIESRRAAAFEQELLTRARTWIPSWSLDESEADFGLALLKIAARYHSEVAERLNKTGEKMALGFLDWLGIQAQAARPARMPVVFKMADTAREPVLAPSPVKVQADVRGATVTFETESDLRIVPGQLAAVVAVDPEADSYYLPPPGLTSLDPLEPLPKAWKLKNFAAPGSKTLQLDPGIGLVKDMLVDIAGNQYRIREAKDDLVTIESEVPAGDGFEGGTRVSKVETFRPFGGARNLQEHILYIGDSDALNIEAAALIEVIAPASLQGDAKWEYWGKADGEDGADADAAWLELPTSDLAPGRLVLAKREGATEEKEIEGVKARWIRARRIRSEQLIAADEIAIKINPVGIQLDPGLSEPPIELFANATPSPTRNVFLFGQEPRLFDTLYVGCAEAFSKADAKATIDFNLSDGAFDAMAGFDAGKLGSTLAAVDKGGSLHIFSVAADGKLQQLNDREPLRPDPRDATDTGASNFSLTSWNLRPAMWLVGDRLHVAVAAKGEIWVRVETPSIDIGFGITIPPLGHWEYWGSVSGDPDMAITSMAVVNQAGVPTLVVMSENKELRRRATAGSDWQIQPLPLPAGHQLLEIASVRSSSSLKAADNFIAVTAEFAIGPFTLRLGPTGAETIQNIDPSLVSPFGFEVAGATVVVAARRSPAQLVAMRGGVSSEVDLDSVTPKPIMLDGRLDGAELAVYGTGELSGTPVLFAWAPFKPGSEDLLISTPIEILTRPPKGPVAVIGNRIFVPGDRKREVLTATASAPSRFSANANEFLSAVAISSSVQLPAAIDRLFVMVGSTATEASVQGSPTAGIGSYAGFTFLWLGGAVARDTAVDDVFIFPPSANPLPMGTVSQTAAGSEIDLGQPVEPGLLLIVDRGSAGPGENLVRIAAMTGTVATVEPDLSAPDGEDVEFRVSQKVDGRVFPGLQLGSNIIDRDKALAGGIYFPVLKPRRQPVIALAEAGTALPEFLAFELEWATGPGAAAVDFFVSTDSDWSQARAAPSATAVLAWEYWDGTSWSVLDLTGDTTSNLRQSGAVEFTVPRDLQPVDWAGKTTHWVRARIIGGNYGETKVEVVSVQNGTTTTQTVKRTSDDLQPPYAVSVSVAYSVDKAVIPTFLITRDSGALRDQSDANRTPGAQVEIFTPLKTTLDRLDSPASSTATDGRCVPDCECAAGTPSTSPAAPSTTHTLASTPATASGAARRALYLGFTSKLLGGPVNILFNVERENDYDSIGPLRADGLIADRFAPVVATDETRALGESGLLKMSFDVAPLKADLFGHSLSWLRLAPRVVTDDWQPSIAGIFPNGVWARSAETMTRELLGSSDGRPALTVTLARPPLLRNSLELRVNEPLGEEEVMELQDKDPNLVKTAETDLPGKWVLWKQVQDPSDCGARDRVYSLDEATGVVRFGDGLHGMIPPPGVDVIVAFKYQRTEAPVGDKVAANWVNERDELNLVTPVESVETVVAAGASAGGTAPESSIRVLQFAPAKLRHRNRAVSLRDFEQLVLQKSEEVVQARAFRRNGRVRLIVVTKGTNISPSRAQQREWRRTLLEVAPPSLGVRNGITIEGPRVLRLVISLTLRVRNLDFGGKVAEQAKDRLIKCFDPAAGWSLGRTARDEDIAEALLDIPDLDGIVSIGLFEVDEFGTERPWRVPVAPDELITLAPENVRVGFDVVEAAA